MNHIELLIEAVGNRARGYYAKKFFAFCENGVPFFDWNPAGLLGVAWFFYRKIWIVVLPAVSLLIAAHFLPNGLILTLTVLALTSLVGCCFGNQIYFRWITWVIAHGRKLGLTNDEELRKFLRHEGGTADTTNVL